METSLVFLRRKDENRCKFFLKLLYDDRLDELEVMEAGGDAMETVVIDEVLLACLYSLELSEIGWVDCEVRDDDGL